MTGLIDFLQKAMWYLTPKFLKRMMQLRSCKDVAIEICNGETKGFFPTLKLWAHLAICFPCMRFFRQIENINQKIKKASESKQVPEAVKNIESDIINQYSK